MTEQDVSQFFQRSSDEAVELLTLFRGVVAILPRLDLPFDSSPLRSPNSSRWVTTFLCRSVSRRHSIARQI